MTTQKAPPRRYTTANAATRLGCSPQYVRRLGNTGVLPPPQPHPDVEAWLTWDAAAVDGLAARRAADAATTGGAA